MKRSTDRNNHGGKPDEESLALEFKDRIYYLSLKKLRDPEAARDVTQETLMALLDIVREEKVKNPDNIGALVYGITRNKIADYFKRKEKQKKLEAELRQNLDHFIPPPAEETENEPERKKIRRLIRQLKPMDRKILFLFFNRKMNPRQIAAQLKLSPHYVSVRKYRALRKIKKGLR